MNVKSGLRGDVLGIQRPGCPESLYMLILSRYPVSGLGLASSTCGNDLILSTKKSEDLKPYYKLQEKQSEVYETTEYNPLVVGDFRGVWGPLIVKY